MRNFILSLGLIALGFCAAPLAAQDDGSVPDAPTQPEATQPAPIQSPQPPAEEAPAQPQAGVESVPADPHSVEADNAEPAEVDRPAANAEAARQSREMLALYGVDASRWSELVDGQAMADNAPDSAEYNALLRLLYAAGRFSPRDLFRWRQQQVDWHEVIEQSVSGRGQILELNGRVVLAEAFDLPADLSERFGFDRFYRCEMILGEEGDPATVYALHVPRAWPLGESIDEPASALGFYAKRAGEPPAALWPVFVAKRIAWHPDDMVLGALGMDVGLLDLVDHKSTRLDAERECFYAMLAACREAGTQQLGRWSTGDYSVVPLFNRPESQTGQLVALNGTARRIVKVLVEDEDIIERYGIDHYYQIAMFTRDSQDNPLVFCVLQLPPEMPEGERLHVEVRIPGFYLKRWGFSRGDNPNVDEASLSEADRQRLARLRQLAPLLIGREPLWIRPESSGWWNYVGITFSLLFVGSIVVLWGLVWWQTRADKRFHEQTIARHYAPEEDASLDEMGLEYRRDPDFSNLP